MKPNLNEILSRVEDKQVYLLHAAESCYPYIMFVLDRLQKKLTNTTKYHYQVDRYFKFETLNDILDNGSLFAWQNIIELNFKTKPTVAQEEALSDLIQKIDSNSYLFITTDKLTSLSSNWIKKINAIGLIIGLGEADTAVIIQHLLTEAKLSIDGAALNLLLELNSGNIPELLQEINRLSLLYPEQHKIAINDIQRADNAQYNVYALSNAYLAGDLTQSKKILENIFNEPADAILIMWMINEDIKKLLKIKSRLKDKINIHTAVSELRVWGDAVNNLKIASDRLNYNTLLSVLEMLATLDMTIKGLQSNSPQIILLKIIEAFCQKSM